MSAPQQFDAIVVGSGFGGSVCTYKLAKAGLKVCLLERGKPYPPGSFPRTRRALQRNFWDPSKGYYGMYNVWTFDGIEAVISSGLGGGSLIYANVLLRRPPEWFDDHYSDSGEEGCWPLTYADLERHYCDVEQMLSAQRYPFDHEPYCHTAKTEALQEAAGDLGLEWQLPPLAVSFGNGDGDPAPGQPIELEYPNLHERPRVTCLLCGECFIGCNYGSKNTLDHTYLSAAKHAKAEIRTLAEVRSFAPAPDGSGYVVRYVQHNLAREGWEFETECLNPIELRTDRLILAAGSLGTTFLLLKNRSEFPDISPMLGHRFSGNGDFLGLAVNAKQADTAPGNRPLRDFGPAVGPTITSAIRVDDAGEGDHCGGRGFYIQEAGYPAFATWTLAATGVKGMLQRAFWIVLHRINSRLNRKVDSDLSAEIARILGEGSGFESTIPLLGMGLDVPDGVMHEEDNHLYNDWTLDSSKPFFDGLRATMRDIARAWQAKYVDNPTYHLQRVITVHPLGGCPMGVDREHGVVDTHGEVFGYPGLYVADGSAMPGPTGANPSLTIAAFASRCAEGILSGASQAPPASANAATTTSSEPE